MSVAVKKLDGVETVDVSLNEGRVTVRFARGNGVTIHQLRRTIRNQGFSPREATLTLSAVIETRDGILIAVIPGSEAAYTLIAEDEVRARLARGAGATFIVQGRLEADEDGVTPNRLAVTAVDGV